MEGNINGNITSAFALCEHIYWIQYTDRIQLKELTTLSMTILSFLLEFKGF